uniref:START domain-containing protein n=1 Tax=Cucumis melo TaxID=3656 RepID=A0A9I9EJG3_CUCME
MPYGYSKVTWAEHVEVDDCSVHSLYNQLVSSGHTFNAKRWIATLDRQCEVQAKHHYVKPRDHVDSQAIRMIEIISG